MTTTKVFTKGFLSLGVIGLCAASSSFADAELMNGQDKGGTVLEVSGDQRIVEIDASDSSVCVVDSMVVGDQRKPDRHKADLNESSIETEECAAHDYMMPMNR